MVDQKSERAEGGSATIGEAAPNVAKVPALLKAFVITTGVMLIIGALALVVLIIMRAASGGSPAPAASPDSVSELELPADAKVQNMMIDGRRLVLLAEDEAGRQLIAIVDAQTGERQNLIHITPSK